MTKHNPSASISPLPKKDSNTTFLVPMSYAIELRDPKQDFTLQTFDLRTCMCFVIASKDYFYMAHVDPAQAKDYFHHFMTEKVTPLVSQGKQVNALIFGKAAENEFFKKTSGSWNAKGLVNIEACELGESDGVQVKFSPPITVLIDQVDQGLIDQAPSPQRLRYQALNDLRLLETYIAPPKNMRSSVPLLEPNNLMLPIEKNKEFNRRISHLDSLPSEQSANEALLGFILEVNPKGVDAPVFKSLIKAYANHRNYKAEIDLLDKGDSFSQLSVKGKSAGSQKE